MFLRRLVITLLSLSLVMGVAGPVWAEGGTGTDSDTFLIEASSVVEKTVDPAAVTRRLLSIGNFDYYPYFTWPNGKGDLVGPYYDYQNILDLYAKANFGGATFSERYYGRNAYSISFEPWITQVFGSADSNDISYFYFSGHGNRLNGVSYLVGVNNSYFSAAELKQVLDKIQGTKVIILDTCYSGGFIGSPGKETSLNDVSIDFNKDFISAFSKENKNKKVTGGSYKILTACSSEQTAPDGNNSYGSPFTYYLITGCGGMEATSMYADTNYNGYISLQEAYQHTYTAMSKYKCTAQAYPVNDTTFNLYGKTSTTGTSVTGIKLNKAIMQVETGHSENLVATVTPPNALNKNITWTSSNNSVAIVSSSGNVTGVGKGNAIITATTQDGGFSATCTANIIAGADTAVTGVALNKESAYLKTGDYCALVAGVTPSNATNKTVTWHSDNPAIATVDNNGIVKGVSAGTANIIVTTIDGGYTDSCLITVYSNVSPPTASLPGTWKITLKYNGDKQKYLYVKFSGNDYSGSVANTGYTVESGSYAASGTSTTFNLSATDNTYGKYNVVFTAKMSGKKKGSGNMVCTWDNNSTKYYGTFSMSKVSNSVGKKEKGNGITAAFINVEP